LLSGFGSKLMNTTHNLIPRFVDLTPPSKKKPPPQKKKKKKILLFRFRPQAHIFKWYHRLDIEINLFEMCAKFFAIINPGFLDPELFTLIRIFL
jgi:hypothetical protein